MADGSILNSVKKVLGLADDYTAFDDDVIMHINSALSTLTQLGIGPTTGYMIDDAGPAWANFIGDDNQLNMVKTYVCLKVRLVFDPPTTSYVLTAMQDQIRELEWRISERRESLSWTDPNAPVV